jgi:cupin 2 domain-containing protein
VITSNDGNLFASRPNPRAEEQFDLLLQTGSCRLERIVSMGHATPPGEWYDQDEDEWVALVQGRAKLQLAGEVHIRKLSPGDYVWLPAHCRHRVEWTSAQPPAIWLALHLKGSD